MQFSFTTCLEVNEALVEEALAPAADLLTPTPRKRVLGLLQRMFQVAEPGQGAPRILLVLSRLARCPWLEGALVVRLRADAEGTRIELLEDDGIAPERLCPVTVIKAPLREFERAVQLRPDLLKPLIRDEIQGPQLVLRATERVEVDSVGALGIVDRSLLQPERAARPQAQVPPPITWSKSGPAVVPRTDPEQRPAPAIEAPRAVSEATTRMPAQQAAELVARIKLKKQTAPGGPPDKPPEE